MKRTTLAFITLVSLILIGCGDHGSASSPEPKTAPPPAQGPAHVPHGS